MMRRTTLVLGFLTLSTSAALRAQLPDNVKDMLRRIYASGEFAPDRFGPARWIENGAAYTTVERSAAIEDAADIVRYETATGARRLLPRPPPHARGNERAARFRRLRLVDRRQSAAAVHQHRASLA